ncbi:MAG TPA: IS5 family transposase [Nitrososphaeraceae archaeon]|nr:IS5 family transposase [Nitrososphaeraceae archaeon]
MNWNKYNESLVKRGEVLLDFDVIDNWDNELEEMNKGKEGRKFVYPDSFIKLLGYMRAYFHLPYRQTEGIVRAHAANTLPSIPDYSRICRRINRLNIKINDDNDDVNNNSSLQHDDYFIIAIDSTGIKVSNRGEWIRHKWNVKRGYLKIHVAVDIKKKRILSLIVTSEQVHDGKVLPQLIDDITIKQNKVIDTAIMDGSYDSNKNFQLLSFKGIQSAIKVRKNSRCKKTNHYLRNKNVQLQKTNMKQWKDSVCYGQRWIVETVFSCIKRLFGEYVTAIRFENIIKEIILKASLYNWFQSITAN